MRIEYTANEKIRKFEIPYNFDPNYLTALQIMGLTNDWIEYIYMAPFHEDYTTVIREDLYGAGELTREQYVEHIHKLNEVFPGKLQLLLQSKTNLMDLQQLKWYIDLGFTAFCCGNIQQAQMIKQYNPKLVTISSILMHTARQNLTNRPEYESFDYVVLDFSYGRHLQKIKELPESKKYMILVNAYCNTQCNGDRHWLIKDITQPVNCPGLLFQTRDFSQTVLIRPMDLKYFDPYISVYKIQDRSWPTEDIIRDILLYTTDFTIYPGIEYDEQLYDTDDRM